MGGFIANKQAWNALPASYKVAVEVALAEIDTDQNARYDAWNPPALRRLIAGGAQLRAWPREVMQAAWRESHGLYDELAFLRLRAHQLLKLLPEDITAHHRACPATGKTRTGGGAAVVVGLLFEVTLTVPL
jgi:TRAP-type mannitol/chloroaromatic compound transport system substrate-binding protein